MLFDAYYHESMPNVWSFILISDAEYFLFLEIKPDSTNQVGEKYISYKIHLLEFQFMNTVTAYFSSNQLLHFGFEQHFTWSEISWDFLVMRELWR